jgi:hypothetical protein
VLTTRANRVNSSRARRTSLRRTAAFLSVGCVVAALVGVTSPAAHAYDATQSAIVTDNPADWTPDVVSSGGVRYLAQAGSTMIAAGSFTQVKNHGSSTVLTRNNIFSFNATTGVVNTAFAPNVDGMIHSLVVSPDGLNVFLGGEFSHVNGASAIGIAEVNIATGALVTTFKPALNGRVFTMRLSGGKLYIGGGFTKVGTQAIAELARLNPTTGAPDTTFKATFTGTNNPSNPGPPLIIKMDINPAGNRLVAIGNWVQVNGVNEPQIAQFDVSGTTASLVNWETDRFSAPCSSSYQTYMHDVEFSPDGSYFVVGTTGGAYNGKTTSVGCDSASRWETNTTGTAIKPTWIDFTGNDTLWSIAITGIAVYTGGHNRWMNNAYGSDAAGPGAVDRPGLSALDPLTGVPFTWNPTRTTGVGVFDLLATSTGLWIGDDTDYVGHEYHYKLAFFPLTGGTTVPTVNPGSLPGDSYQLGSGPVVSGSVGTCGQSSTLTSKDIVTRRHIDPSATPIAGTAVPITTTGVAWSHVRGAFMLDNNLYTGWSNGQLCRQTFNGSTFGAATPINLYNNKFMGDLATVTSMAFNGNEIYYTLKGQQHLYSRGFVPQSQIVAAQSHTPADAVSGIDFTKVTGMFIDGSHFYFAYASSGALMRMDWNGSAPTGTKVKVSGPTVDGISWASAGLFLYPGPSAPAAKVAAVPTTAAATPSPTSVATPTAKVHSHKR